MPSSAKGAFDPFGGNKFDPLKGMTMGLGLSVKQATPKPADGREEGNKTETPTVGGERDNGARPGGARPATVTSSTAAPVPTERKFNVQDAAALIRQSGVRDFVEFKNSGYNQIRKPGTRLALAGRAGPTSAVLDCLAEESSRSGSESPTSPGLRRPHSPHGPPLALAVRARVGGDAVN
jgi:hypothetical protein